MEQRVIDAISKWESDGNGILTLKSMKLKSSDLESAIREVNNRMLKNRSLKITDLDLSDNGFTKLPDNICTLELKSLSLANNKCIQQKGLFETIFKMNSLTKLNLANNKISELPKSILGLTSLTSIILFGNEFKEFPPILSKFSGLEEINLGGNKLSEFPVEVTEFKSLKVLSLAMSGLKKLPDDIQKLSNLTDVNLSGNEFKEFPSNLLNIRGLKNLYLGRNSLRGLPEGIGNLTEIESLHLNNNNFVEFPNEIISLKKIINLNLSYNNISSLPDNIHNLTKLSHLDLSSTVIDDFGLDSLVNVKSLKVLCLNSCSTIREKRRIPEGFWNLTSLEKIELAYCRLNSEAFNKKMDKFTNLTSVNLFTNFITKIPPALLSIPNLEHLNLSANANLNLFNLQELTKLKSLDLGATGISSFPAIISQFLNLKELTLSDNSISVLTDEIKSHLMKTAEEENPLKLDLKDNPLNNNYDNQIFFKRLRAKYKESVPTSQYLLLPDIIKDKGIKDFFLVPRFTRSLSMSSTSSDASNNSERAEIERKKQIDNAEKYLRNLKPFVYSSEGSSDSFVTVDSLYSEPMSPMDNNIMRSPISIFPKGPNFQFKGKAPSSDLSLNQMYLPSGSQQFPSPDDISDTSSISSSMSSESPTHYPIKGLSDILPNKDAEGIIVETMYSIYGDESKKILEQINSLNESITYVDDKNDSIIKGVKPILLEFIYKLASSSLKDDDICFPTVKSMLNLVLDDKVDHNKRDVILQEISSSLSNSITSITNLLIKKFIDFNVSKGIGPKTQKVRALLVREALEAKVKKELKNEINTLVEQLKTKYETIVEGEMEIIQALTNCVFSNNNFYKLPLEISGSPYNLKSKTMNMNYGIQIISAEPNDDLKMGFLKMVCQTNFVNEPINDNVVYKLSLDKINAITDSFMAGMGITSFTDSSLTCFREKLNELIATDDFLIDKFSNEDDVQHLFDKRARMEEFKFSVNTHLDEKPLETLMDEKIADIKNERTKLINKYSNVFRAETLDKAVDAHVDFIKKTDAKYNSTPEFLEMYEVRNLLDMDEQNTILKSKLEFSSYADLDRITDDHNKELEEKTENLFFDYMEANPSILKGEINKSFDDETNNRLAFLNEYIHNQDVKDLFKKRDNRSKAFKSIENNPDEKDRCHFVSNYRKEIISKAETLYSKYINAKIKNQIDSLKQMYDEHFSSTNSDDLSKKQEYFKDIENKLVQLKPSEIYMWSEYYRGKLKQKVYMSKRQAELGIISPSSSIAGLLTASNKRKLESNEQPEGNKKSRQESMAPSVAKKSF
ncbi:hypothetical protein OAC51_06040 [Flavobacteriaceae bacterium]|nr:hypothetical protein [Flavobacteriaceae bacterium]